VIALTENTTWLISNINLNIIQELSEPINLGSTTAIRTTLRIAINLVEVLQEHEEFVFGPKPDTVESTTDREIAKHLYSVEQF
jgi:hypothetical protein